MSAEEAKFYYNDIVCKKNPENKIFFGVIWETEDWLISEDEENKSKLDLLKKKYVNISWISNGARQLVHQDTLTLFDRFLQKGDIVRRKGGIAQLGFCLDINLNVSLRILNTNKVISNISADNLLPLSDLNLYDIVLYENWIGVIKNIEREIVVETSDKSKFILREEDIYEMDKVYESRKRDIMGPGSVYIGQVLSGRTYLFMNARKGKISCNIKRILNVKKTKIQVQIKAFNVQSVEIEWICVASGKPTEKDMFSLPNTQIQKRNINKIVKMNKHHLVGNYHGAFIHYRIDAKDTIQNIAKWRTQVDRKWPFKSKSPWAEKVVSKPEESNASNQNAENTHEIISADAISKNVKVLNLKNNAAKTQNLNTSIGKPKVINSKLVGSMIAANDAEGPILKNYSTKVSNLKTGNVKFGNSKSDSHNKTISPNMNNSKKRMSNNAKEFRKTPISKSKKQLVPISEEGGSSISISISTSESEEIIPKRKRPSEMKGPSKKIRSNRNSNKNTQHLPIVVKPGEIVAAEVVLCNTTANILWQDGTIENMICSCELVPLSHIDDNEYFPGDFVTDKSTVDINVYGCIKKVDHTDRTALITWMRYSPTATGQSRIDILKEEKCSVYRLREHADFKFQQGSFVIRINNNDQNNRFANVGKVIEVQFPGHISVNWLNGKEELMCPQDLYYVNTTEMIDALDDDVTIGSDSWSSISVSSVSGKSVKDIKTAIFSLWGLPITDEVDSYDLSLDTLVTNPLFEFARVIEYFIKNPTPHIASEIFKLFECSRYCKNFRTFLLECLKLYADRFVGKWNKFLTDFCMVDKQKTEMIYAILCDSSSLNSELDESKHFELEDMLNDYDPTFKQANKETNDFINTLQALKFSEEFCGKKYSSTPIPIGCHKLCILFNNNLHKFDDDSDSAETDIEGKITLRDFLDGIASQLKEILSPESKLKIYTYPVKIEAFNPEIFMLVDNVPSTHHYKNSVLDHSPTFSKIIQREFNILKTSLPSDICIKGFMDRIDLFSVMVKGPQNTPYEDGLFLFDIQLPQKYPDSPPNVFYISFCTDRLNPNLYQDGKVCLSLLGTWMGEGTEIWVPNKSNLYQLLVSIQGLILVSEPYYNEAGYEKQVGSFLGIDNSRLYNEMAVLKTIESTIAMIHKPTETFKEEILNHFKINGSSMLNRYQNYALLSETLEHPDTIPTPGFPLLPGSAGFCISLKNCIERLRKAINTIGSLEVNAE